MMVYQDIIPPNYGSTQYITPLKRFYVINIALDSRPRLAPDCRGVLVYCRISMFEAVYISDINKTLIYEYLINLRSPSFNSLVSVINQKWDFVIEINPHYSVYLYETSNVIIYTLTSSNINPVLPFAFINRLLEVIHDYFGTPLAITKIDANNDTLTLLINQMLDGGIPNITDFNKLRDLVPFKSFLSSILSKTNDFTRPSKLPKPVTTNTAVPWRASNVKHTNNEMYVDIFETINIILKSSSNKVPLKQFDSAYYSNMPSASSKSLIPVTGNIQGKVVFTSHLSGTPTLQINVSNPLDNPRYHKCIELSNFRKNQCLTFIPPDGKFDLVSYSVDLNAFNRSQQLSMLGQVNIDYNYGLGANKNEFEIKLYIPIKTGVAKIENLKLEIDCNIANIVNIKSSRVTHGDFQYKGDSKAEWNLRTLSTGINPILYGAIITEDIELEDHSVENLTASAVNVNILKPSLIKLNYTNKGCVPSGLKVDSLKIINFQGLSNNIKPYKGVKYITETGDFSIRS